MGRQSANTPTGASSLQGSAYVSKLHRITDDIAPLMGGDADLGAELDRCGKDTTLQLSANPECFFTDFESPEAWHSRATSPEINPPSEQGGIPAYPTLVRLRTVWALRTRSGPSHSYMPRIAQPSVSVGVFNINL